MHTIKYSYTELTRGILAGDVLVLNYIYDTCYPVIQKMITNNSGVKEDAQDVFQDAMVILYRNLKEKKIEHTGTLNGYLFILCRNIWFNRKKRKTLYVGSSLDMTETWVTDPTILEEIYRNERLNLYRSKFEELSENCKRVLRMFLNGVPIRDITETMGYRSVQHTKNRHFRCKMSLIAKIKASKTYTELIHGNKKENKGLPGRKHEPGRDEAI
ncbi:MAG: hypothetical protein JW801_14555 [Bacteroidales bacterium]|nr:hypothetical protein [Bacteroidales bacterium]